MNRFILPIATILCLVAACTVILAPAIAQDKPVPDSAGTQSGEEEKPLPFKYVSGPTQVKIGDQAEIEVPEGFFYVDRSDVSNFLEWTGNLPSDGYLGMLAKKEMDWWVLFSFDPFGYVKDDEKTDLNADEMLDSLKASVRERNDERKRRGMDTLEVLRWVKPPHYNESTHNLEWSTLIKASDETMTVNHNTRYLGRYGVMEVELIANDENFEGTLSAFNDVNQSFRYSETNKYAAWLPGDKVAEYGLTALVVGGAAAVAAKGGLFKGLWKLLVFAAVGLAGFVKKLFGKKSEDDTSNAIS